MKVAVVHCEYPQSHLTKKDLQLSLHAILMAYEKIPENGPQVRFSKHLFGNGYLLIYCADEESKEWLILEIPKLIPRQGLYLKALIGNAIPKKYFFTVFISDEDNEKLTHDRIISRLKVSNHILKPQRWNYWEKKPAEKGQTWTFNMDRQSVDCLKKLNFQPYCGCGKVIFKKKGQKKYCSQEFFIELSNHDSRNLSSWNSRNKSSKDLTFYYQNVRGLRGKIDILKSSISATDYDIICLTETWLDPEVSDSEIFSSIYSVYRNDRDFRQTYKTKGGGVLLAISSKSNIDVKRIPVSKDKFEDLWLFCQCDGKSLVICSCYIQPNSSAATYERFLEKLEAIDKKYPKSELLICGDFNLPLFCQQQDTLISFNLTGYRRDFLNELMTCFNLRQWNSTPNSYSRMLDLILCSFQLNELSECNLPLVKIDSHHPPLKGHFSLNNI